jgi:hypothetical protein
MTEAELRQLSDAVSQLLRPHLERSEPLRQSVALLGKWLCEQVAQTSESTGERIDSEAGSSEPKSVPPEPAPPSERDPHRRPTSHPTPPSVTGVVPLKLGDALAHISVAGTTRDLERVRAAAADGPAAEGIGVTDARGSFDIDLALVETRCRLKAASCRLAIEGRAAAVDPTADREVHARIHEMISEAKSLPNCFLWVFLHPEWQPADAILGRVAACYDAQADAIALLRQVDGVIGGPSRGDEELALELLAEANSALRVALASAGRSDGDRDQGEAHKWLRAETGARSVFVERYMRLDDPADPSNAEELRARIKEQVERLSASQARGKAIKEALGRIRYHAGRVVKEGADEAPGHWSKVWDAVQRLVELGIPVTDRRVAEAIGPEAAAMWGSTSSGAGVPEGMAAGWAAGWDAGVAEGIIGRASKVVGAQPRPAAAGREAEPPSGVEGEGDERAWSTTVFAVRAMLRGKRMVIIGGERRPDAIERLTAAFELHDVEWVKLREHGSGLPMRAPIARSDTAVVVVIVKLAGHLHAEEARVFASETGKACVMLAGGYNPEQVAVEILKQASGRLN